MARGTYGTSGPPVPSEDAGSVSALADPPLPYRSLASPCLESCGAGAAVVGLAAAAASVAGYAAGGWQRVADLFVPSDAPLVRATARPAPPAPGLRQPLNSFVKSSRTSSRNGNLAQSFVQGTGPKLSEATLPPVLHPWNRPASDLRLACGLSPGAALGLSAACAEDLLLLSPAHLAVLWVLVWRALRLRRPPGPLAELPAPSAKKSRPTAAAWPELVGVGACLLSMLLPLQALVAAGASGTLLAIPAASHAIVILTWAMLLLVGSREYKVRGRWAYRSATAMLLVASAFRSRHALLPPASVLAPGWAAVHGLQLVGQLFLCAGAAVGWPSAKRGRALGTEDLPPSDDQVCPERTSSLPSQLLWNWLSPLVRKGARAPLTQRDVWQVHPTDGARVNHEKFLAMWRQEKQRGQPSLFRALWRAFGAQFAVAGVWRVLVDGFSFLGPLLLGRLVQVVSGDAPATQGYLIAVALFVAQFLVQLCDNIFLRKVFGVGLHVQGALTAEIYQKSLRLSSRARATMPTGQIINHMAVDAEQLQMAINTGHVVWAAPLRIVIAVVFLYRVLGVAALVGVGALVLLFPLQMKAAKYTGRYTLESRKHSDARVHLINEILAGIRVIKALVWERPFLKRVAAEREQELRWFRKVAVLRALMNLFVGVSPLLLALASFSTYSLLGGTLTPAITFPSLSLFAIVQLPLWFIPPAFQSLLQAKVAYGRLKAYFLAEEVVPPLQLPPSEGTAVRITAGDFRWQAAGDAPPVLRGVTLAVPRGELVCVVGATGSGKSSLLQALAGEMECAAGEVALQGRVAYVAQKPWLCRGTVRENVVFGTPLDGPRYRRAVTAAQLAEDIRQFDGQDDHDLGEGGVNLSGGQRQRVSLARALYRDADIYLLDDPLSALDAKVGRAVFEEAICGALAHTTRLWVCNQLQFLAKADRIIVMHEGEISGTGTYEELLQSNAYFAELMQQQTALGVAAEPPTAEAQRDASAYAADKVASGADGIPVPKGTLVQEERVVTGTTLSPRNVRFYMSALGGVAVVGLILVLYALIEVCRIGNQLWLTWWSGPRWPLPLATWLTVYALWGLAQTAFALLQAVFLADRGILAARRVHEAMLTQLMKAPTSFFDATPRGRIVNRFTKDQATIDGWLMFSVSAFISACAQLLTTTLLVVVNTPYTCIVLVPLTAFFARTQRRFQRTARELKRMDAVTRSPIYSHFGETLNGMATIRSFAAQDHMSALNYQDLLNNQRFAYLNLSVNRWLAARLELIGSAVMFCAGCFAVQQRQQLGAATLGLILSQTSNITALLGFFIRMTAELENAFNSVERAYEYTALPAEPQATDPLPPVGWPFAGEVVFRNVSMRYRDDLPLCLKDLDFMVRPGEKVGVVGRTGAGKSSLAVGLCRFCELATGAITIDGIDIATVPLQYLRRVITVIPQDAVLFGATIRFNLDPDQERLDPELWAALQQVNLRDYVEGLPGGLDAEIREGGDPFSVGGKQLLCLARALLHRSRVVIIDEATANIDSLTDDLIQRTIRTQFADCTVITIAHRLRAIMDCDRVMVLHDGRLTQFDSPGTLLRIPRTEPSMFRDLADQGGLATLIG